MDNRKKSQSPPSSFVLCVVTGAALMVFACCGPADASPALNPHQNIAVGKFQGALQQQNFLSILTSIEERLRNLDNIYSMQLSQTLETKLDQYSRRLEALDTKIIRLEALVMLNLDKISENISTKNFKDDMTRTNLFRKMDSVYEGVSHRLGYLERKFETNLGKIHTKIDSTFTRLEKLDENMMMRDSDIEAEMSDAIFAIDDLKTTCTQMEEKLYNITATTLNVTKESYKSMQSMNVDSRKSMNVLHDNIIENLRFMNNRTSRHFKMVDDNNLILRNLKSDLQEDFNDYANKVADMSSYMWKNTDTIEDDLKTLQAAVNNTKIEVQNGVRSLMVQIGKISSKENTIPGDNPLDDINTNLNTNFQKILTNQDIFLESCHRLQMDESQIESEISVMLEKLIDMLEKKMSSEMKDIKNLEKALKTHDGRILRNVYQINSNVISLFEKSTINKEDLLKEVKKIGNDLDALFAFIQSTVTAVPQSSINTKILQDKLDTLQNTISTISRNQTQKLRDTSRFDNSIEEIKNQIQRFHKSLAAIEFQVNQTINEDIFEKIITKISQKSPCNSCDLNITKIETKEEIQLDNHTAELLEEIFGPNPDFVKTNVEVENANSGKKRCKQNYLNLIDVRSGLPENCEETQENSGKIKKKGKKNKKKKSYKALIDARGNFGDDEVIEYEDSDDNFESTTLDPEEFIGEDNFTTETTTINEDLSEIKPNNTVN